MKTTVILEDELYEALVRFAETTWKSKRKLSAALNSILAERFGKKNDLFGTTKPFSLRGMRDKHDRFD